MDDCERFRHVPADFSQLYAIRDFLSPGFDQLSDDCDFLSPSFRQARLPFAKRPKLTEKSQELAFRGVPIEMAHAMMPVQLRRRW